MFCPGSSLNEADSLYSKNMTTLNFGKPKSFESDVVKSLFEKKFKYIKGPNWILPPINELFKEHYRFDNLQLLKNELISVKSKLNDFVIEDWSVHTRKKDPSSEVPFKLKSDICAEFVTVAWCKLFECLHQYEIVKSGNINSLHLCEAPGAFITALNHYLHSTYEDVHWNWLSTTLNPYYEGNPLTNMIIDDRFMLHTLDRWLFHEDFSGNIMNHKNVEHIQKECKRRLGDVHLVTADGSVDCIETPDNQEEHVFTLHYTEICTALLILTKGGSFVVKMFTLFEAPSVNIVYFLNCIFKEVNIFKPATSKRGNSEVYLVCLDYEKPDNINEYLNIMLTKLDCNKILPLFPKSCIPLDFCLQHEVCTRKFMHEQIKAIESNIHSYLYRHPSDNKKCHFLRVRVREHFFELYKVKPIAPDKRILQNPKSKIQHGTHTQIYRGSFTGRKCVKEFPIEDKIFLLIKSLNDIEKSFLWQYDEIACIKQDPNEIIPLKLYKGKPLDELRSSLFAAVEILVLRSKIYDLYNTDPIFTIAPFCVLSGAIYTKNSSIAIENHSNKFDTKLQQHFFSKILQAIADHQPKKIIFINMPLLTHFSVSILRYLIANVFDSCTISGKKEIILETEVYSDKAIQSVHDILNVSKDCPEVLCFVDIFHLHRNQFYKAICDYNNQLLMDNYKIILKT